MVLFTEGELIQWLIASAVRSGNDVMYMEVSAAVAPRHLAAEMITLQDSIVPGISEVSFFGEQSALQESCQKAFSHFNVCVVYCQGFYFFCD